MNGHCHRGFVGHWSGINEGFTAWRPSGFNDLSHLYIFDAIQSEVLPTLHR